MIPHFFVSSPLRDTVDLGVRGDLGLRDVLIFFFSFFFGRTLLQDLSDRASLIRSDRLIIEKVIEVFADGLF